MKFLLVLAVLVVAFWLWRNGRRAVGGETPGSPQQPAKGAVPVVACDFCGMHLPESELVKGERGRYCCQEHRRRHEAASS